MILKKIWNIINEAAQGKKKIYNNLQIKIGESVYSNSNHAFELTK